jgi:hypothetical protein
VTFDARVVYGERLASWDRVIATSDRRHLAISNLRLGAAFVAAFVAWLGFGAALIAPSWALLPVALFLFLMVVHAVILNEQDRARQARRYYERGLSRLDGTWIGTGPDGARFIETHPHARDLDLFGRGSLFQLIDTARTEAGEETLARWLAQGAAKDEIEARQQAVAELRDRLGFRETLAIRAGDAPVSRTGALGRWAAASPVGFGAFHARTLAGCALVTVTLLIASVTALRSDVLLVWLAVQAALAFTWRRRVARVIRGVDAAAYDLGLLSELLASIEKEPFTSARLRTLRERLVAGGVLPSRRIARLQRYIAARDVNRNLFMKPFGLLLVVGSQAAVAIDRWHASHRADLARWLDVVGELEALSSFGTYAFEHPADRFPSVADDGPLFSAARLAHPLIPESAGVRNDVELGNDAPHVLIVSGSNMSGKSTLLRTIGANAVLGLAGAPVRASSLTLSRLVLGATIRIEDSLQDGRSRFYAEILRIRDIVSHARAGQPVLFLLDEILGGTNSHDRRIGAAAIVRALVDAGAIGAMTTHDLALTGLVGELGPLARNVHFDDQIVDGRMLFDYQMRDGIVEHSNALELMRSVGLEV